VPTLVVTVTLIGKAQSQQLRVSERKQFTTLFSFRVVTFSLFRHPPTSSHLRLKHPLSQMAAILANEAEPASLSI